MKKNDTVTTERQRIIDISFALAEGVRILMIDTIKETSGDELETKEDWIEISKETDAQLKFRLHNILQYYLRELATETIENWKDDIEKAKDILRDNGFFVDNLWRVDDVKEKFDCTDDEAMEVLNKSLTNDATMEQIWLAIDIVGESMNLTKI